MTGTLYTSGDFKHLEEAAIGEISKLKENAAAEAIVLAGSNLLCSYFKKRLSVTLDGIFNVHFLTFPDLLSFVEQRSEAERRDPLSSLDSMVLLEELASGIVPDCFSEVAGTDGFVSALHSTFTDLAEGGCGEAGARRLIESEDPRLRHERVLGILDLYARYRELVEAKGGDIHSRFSRAIDLAGDTLEGCAVYAYGFYDLNEMQYRLLAAAMRSGPAAIFVPWCEDTPFRFAAPLVERLSGAGFERIPIESDAASAAETGLFNAPDAVEEAREVVRRIIELRGSGGPRFGEIGVLPWSGGDWPPLREALSRN